MTSWMVRAMMDRYHVTEKLGYNELRHIVNAMFTTAVAVVETGQLECCSSHRPVDQGGERWRLRQFAQ